ncbi:unnamed protein product [Tilletia controversa]|uniref:DUF1754-domain-containing protein n=1 Tax=Tilletia controversa TaxID=13291 RepID=A0A8X7MVD0_9BASI|nr:hypothetical protein CF328_g2938 [Tilletia controversa]KAE8248474.1 hypothetical protein A4X06_0g3688 [Tilletia controversa]CAD6926797.1 unnamed protein product [Tilletia controversa]CAD6947348.1 unnamed protein product [Tilletia controversa]CAD6950240.1 unnamed protein product [Tilletia controversa]
MGEDAYGFKPGGSLKFKDRDAEKKKKKKSKSSTSNGVKVSASSTSSAAVPLASSGTSKASGSTAEEQGAPSGESLSIERTDAERRFDEIQRKRLSEKVKTEAKKSHKDKVDKFNTYLESLSEHYDIPKVGPG